MGPLPTPQDVQVGYPLNDVGALSFSYPPNAPRADVLGQPLELAVECSYDQGATWTEPDSSRFLYLRDGRDPIKTGDAFAVECAAYIQRLAKALVGFTGLDSNGQRVFTNYTPGKILHTLVQEAQNRGALTGLTFDWTDAADSSGTAWPTTVSYSYEAGKSLLSILQEFVDAGLVDFRTQGRNVQMFVAAAAPASVHLEVLDFFGKPSGILISDGRQFVMLASDTGTWLRGAATAESVSRVLPVALPPDQLVAMLLGRAPRLAHVVMGRAVVEALQERPRLGRHHRHLVVVAGEGANGLHGIEPHEGDELHQVPARAPQQLDSAISGYASARDTLEDLGPEQPLVGVRVRGRGPAVPDPADHA